MMRTALAAATLAAAFVGSACAQTTLKDAFKSDFRIGAALNNAHTYEKDGRGAALVKKQFNTITPENALKWERVHPKPGVYLFDAADHFVAFGQKNNMFLVGHTLVWHDQTPAWVFQDDKGNPVDRDTLLKRMHDHIQTVVGRYKGRVNGWDVVNEAVDEDGNLRQSPWLKIIGEDYIARAFQFAQEADPNAELYYIDFSIENEPKRNGALKLIRKLKEQGVKLTGVCLQGHYLLDWPTPQQLDETIAAFADTGVKVHIAELDIDVLPKAIEGTSAEVTLRAASRPELNPYKNQLPDSMQQKLAERYAELFRVFHKHRDTIERVTFWGVTDKDSWKNDWPVKGRTNYPLLFDRKGQPKPAFDAVLKTSEGAD